MLAALGALVAAIFGLFPWVFRALWAPDKLLDLLDRHGRPDHGKIIGVYTFHWFMLLALLGKLPPLGISVALLASSYGSAMFRAYLKRHTSTSTEVITAPLEGQERDPGDTRD